MNISRHSFDQKLQLLRQKLRPAVPKTPVLWLVLYTRDDQITPLEPTLCLQSLRKSRIGSLLDFGIATLLENLDEDQILTSRKAEVRVFADHVAGLVLGDDLRALVGFSLQSQALRRLT